MKTQIVPTVFFLLIATICNCQVEKNFAISSSLKVGSKAPKLIIQSWLKGTAIEKFEEGHMYVVEFGSIACGPCRASIPHLTNLAKTYHGQMTLISVYVYENGYNPTDTMSLAYLERVKNFMRNMDNAIGYSVGVDGPKQLMAESWLAASKLNSIPVAFIVDREGKIAWMGHPLNAEPILRALIEGDPSRIASLVEQEVAFENSIKQLYGHFDSETFGTSLFKIDSLITCHPNKFYLSQIKFNLLLRFDSKAAFAYGRELLMSYQKDNEYLLTDIAYQIFFSKNASTPEGYQLIVDLVNRSLELIRDEIITANTLSLQAQAYFKMGEIERAIKIAEKGLSYLENSGSLNTVEAVRRMLREHIVKFKKFL